MLLNWSEFSVLTRIVKQTNVCVSLACVLSDMQVLTLLQTTS